MTIVRINPDNRWSDAIIHNGTLYSTFVPENPQGNAFDQTANILAQVDALGGVVVCAAGLAIVAQQGVLAARHVDVNIGQQLGIEQCAVQGTPAVVHAQAVTQGIERVAFAREEFFGQGQRVGYAGHSGFQWGQAQQGKLFLQKEIGRAHV